MDIKNETKSETSLVPVEPLQGEILRPGEPVSPHGLNDSEAAGLKTQARDLVSVIAQVGCAARTLLLIASI